MANQKVSRPVGLGFPHRAGRYHVWMDSDPYHARVTPTSCMNPVPMSDRTKLAMLIFWPNIVESEILSCRNRNRCSRVLCLQEVSDLHSEQQAAAWQ